MTDTSVATFDFIFALNVRAPFFLMQRVAPRMRRGGVIVNITSMLDYGGPPFLLGYAASKSALVTLTKGAANTLQRDGLHVVGINLGWTLTPAEQEVQTHLHGMPEDWAERLGTTQPFGRPLLPDDPAARSSCCTSVKSSIGPILRKVLGLQRRTYSGIRRADPGTQDRPTN